MILPSDPLVIPQPGFRWMVGSDLARYGFIDLGTVKSSGSVSLLNVFYTASRKIRTKINILN